MSNMFSGYSTPQNQIQFHSRRSPVLSRYGMVSSSQVLVSQIGANILKKGGNAIDACVAMNAAISVVEPMSTGLGGDCFALYYKSSLNKVYGLNGSGKTSANLNYSKLNNIINKRNNTNNKTFILESNDPHCVTVPGNVCGMIDLLEKHGTFNRETVFKPALKLAIDGFPVSQITSELWNNTKNNLINSNSYGNELLINNRAPYNGEIFKNKYIANVIKEIIVHGKSGFYNSWISDNIVSILQSKGSFINKQDLLNHKSLWVEPIKLNYKNINIYEIPPNGQGIAALIGLNIYQNINNKYLSKLINKNNMFSNNVYSGKWYNSNDLHLKIECMRLGFRYSKQIICDLQYDKNKNINIKPYLTESFGKRVSESQIYLNKINTESLKYGTPYKESDTVSFCAVDSEGNGCSFISSNYYQFGSGIVAKNTGLALQNRGFNFETQDLNNPNIIDGNKRPYHTIIPGLATTLNNNNLYCTFSVMGGYMQPQGHLQVITNMIDRGLNPQEALDAPRFCIGLNSGTLKPKQKESIVYIEDCKDSINITKQLKNKGHKCIIFKGNTRKIFGRGQIIYRDPKNGVMWGGSDGRSDGCALGITHPINKSKL